MAAIGCHKTDITTKSGQADIRNTGAAARTITGNDSAEIVTNVHDFSYYADQLSHGVSGSQGGLSSELSVEAANDLMEATLNYNYGVMGDDLEQSQWYTDSVTISLNGSNTIDLSDVANGYNEALTQIKADYAAVGNVTDKRLEMVDVGVEGTGSSRTFIFTYHIGWDPVNPQAWTIYSIDVPFPNGTNLFWQDGVTNSCNTGTDGAPKFMCRNIKDYFNRFPGLGYAVTTRDRVIPVHIKKEGGILGASTTASNPFAASNSTVMTDHWTHYWGAGTTSQLNAVTCISTSGLNAYRSAIIDYIQTRETALSQEFSNIQLTGVQGSPSNLSRKWIGDYYYADFISAEEQHNPF
jgi:hypothetical protein